MLGMKKKTKTIIIVSASVFVAEAAVDVAIGSLVAGYVFGLTFNAFEAIGGFLFSLKGKMGNVLHRRFNHRYGFRLH